MDDRQLLELAAKAIGLRLYCGPGGPYMMENGVATHHWNPLADNADALRLAVKLKLEIRPTTFAIVVAGNGVWGEESRAHNDDLAATRLCITRVAAAIGEQMEGK